MMLGVWKEKGFGYRVVKDNPERKLKASG